MHTRKIFQIIVLCTMTYVLLIGNIVNADIVVAPNDYANVKGNSNNAYPFFSGFANQHSMRYQQVYDSSQFSSFSGPEDITAIAFRPMSRYGDGASITLPNIQINLSTTNAEPDALSWTLDQNVGADNKVVFSGALSLSTAYRGEPQNGPQTFDIIVYLQTYFQYDPQEGNLLMEVRDFDAQSSGTFQLDAVYIQGDSVSRIENNDVNSPTGSPDTLGLITQFFTFPSIPVLPPPVPFPEPEPVPEPSTMLLLGSGLLGLLGLRGKFKK